MDWRPFYKKPGLGCSKLGLDQPRVTVKSDFIFESFNRKLTIIRFI